MAGWCVDDGSVSLRSGAAHRHTKVNGQRGLNRQSAVQRSECPRARRQRRAQLVSSAKLAVAAYARRARSSVALRHQSSFSFLVILRAGDCVFYWIFAFCEMDGRALTTLLSDQPVWRLDSGLWRHSPLERTSHDRDSAPCATPRAAPTPTSLNFIFEQKTVNTVSLYL